MWTYLRLPLELEGDGNGVVRGVFYSPGSYSFGVVCSDSAGLAVNIFITMNIQPVTFFGAYNIEPVYVKNMYLPTEYDWQSLIQLQTELADDYDYLYQQAQWAKRRYEIIKFNLPEFENMIAVVTKRVETANKIVSLSQHVQRRANSTK